MRHATFEIVPVEDGRFAPMLMEVPLLEDTDDNRKRAGRRAWWQTFHTLGAQGIDHDEFRVFQWLHDETRGDEVTGMSSISEEGRMAR